MCVYTHTHTHTHAHTHARAHTHTNIHYVFFIHSSVIGHLLYFRIYWTATYKKVKVEHFLIPHTKINSKRIKDLNLRPEAIKLMEKEISRTLLDINHSNIIFLCLLRQKKKRKKIKNRTYVNLKAFSQQRKWSRKWKHNLQNGRKYLQMIWLTRG